MKKIIIHMGQYKTGSTSIQKLMWESRDEFIRHGILYPESFVRESAHFLVSDLLKREFRDCNDSVELSPLRDEIEQSDAETTVISCEPLSGATVRRFAPEMMMYVWDRLVRLFDGFDVRVVFYVRRQDESIESRIIQEIKGQSRKSSISFEPYLYENSSLNYYFFTRLLEQVFGQGKVDVRLYDRKSMFKSDVRYDFVHYLGLPLGKISMPAIEHNVTPSAKLVGFCRVLNSLNLSEVDYAMFSGGLWRELCGPDEPNAVILNSKDREQIMEYFHESNVRFVAEYISARKKELFSGSLFGAVRDAETNVFMDGVATWQILKRKGFRVVKVA